MNRLPRLLRSLFFLIAFSSSSIATLGCGGGGIACSVNVGSLEGSWVFTFGSGKNITEIDITIDADGNVTLVAPSPNNPGGQPFTNCKTLKKGLCDLEVQCTDSKGGTFTLDLVRKK